MSADKGVIPRFKGRKAQLLQVFVQLALVPASVACIRILVIFLNADPAREDGLTVRPFPSFSRSFTRRCGSELPLVI